MKDSGLRKAARATGWAVLGSSTAVAARGLWSLHRDLRGLIGPSPREEDRRRLALDADQLESILEKRRKVSDRLEYELSRVDREAQRQRQSEYEDFEKRWEEEQQRNEQIKAERPDRRWGPFTSFVENSGMRRQKRRLGSQAGELIRRLRLGEGARRAVMELRRELGLHSYNFGREELERGEVRGILTPGERELLERMRGAESKNVST